MNSGKIKRARSLIWACEVVGESHNTVRQWIRDGHFRLSPNDQVGRGTRGTDISGNTVRRLAHFCALRWIGVHPEQAGKLCEAGAMHPGAFISARDFRDTKNVNVSQSDTADIPPSSGGPYMVRIAELGKLRAHVETELRDANASN